MPDPVWGTDGSESPDTDTSPADLPARRAPEPVPDWLRSTHDPDRPEPKDRDPVGDIAVAAGFLGIVFFGILLAVVAAVLGAWAGQRARDSGRSYGQAYLAFGLAFVDGVVWLVLHYLTQTPIWIG